METYANTRIGYFIEVARQSRYHAEQWFRYLRKAFSNDGTLLSPADVTAIIDSGELTMFQIITLKRAMQPGTETNEYILSLNKEAALPMIQAVLRKHGIA